MGVMTAPEITHMFLTLGVLLAGARLLGAAARRLRQPAVVGEILAGVLLGPTVLGALAPHVSDALFSAQGASAVLREGLLTLAVAIFLFDAGIGVDLAVMRQQHRAALAVGLAGALVPFGMGFGAALLAPVTLGFDGRTGPLLFALFVATALAITALPVIIRTLQDIGQLRSQVGTIIVAAAVFIDLLGWMTFSLVLGLVRPRPDGGFTTVQTILMTIVFAATVLTLGRFLIHRLFARLEERDRWPDGVQSFALTLALLGAAFTEWIGAKALIGSFLVGVAVGDSSHLGEQTRGSIRGFVSSFFAPIFFAGIGLKVDFAAHFSLALGLVLLAIGSVGKVLGCGLAARLAGRRWHEAWAIGVGMNARGAMEIVLGFIALQHGLIGEELFVALVFVALTTSVLAGPLMQRLLREQPGEAGA